MDIYRFLNSRDVRKYLQDIKYEFTPDQALYVILDSRNSSVQERHEALKELAETYPDYIIEKGKRVCLYVAFFIRRRIRELV